MSHASFLTQQGYSNLIATQKQLEEKRKEQIIELQKAREMGDLSENGLYKATKARLGQIDRQLRTIKFQLAHVTIIQVPSSSVIGIGSTVVLQNNQIKQTYQIVDSFEANPTRGKISYHSPLGKLLMNKKVDEEIILTHSKGEKRFKILQIS